MTHMSGMINAMFGRAVLFLGLFLLPFYVWAYSSVIVSPTSDATLIPIADVSQSQDFFGKLNDFPHTYAFTVRTQTDVIISVDIPNRLTQKHDIALILVKEEKRGVSETARTLAKEQSFTSSYDAALAQEFLAGGTIHKTLDAGTYHLEVSSPSNDALYRLTLGTTHVKYGYFAHVRVLEDVNNLFGNSPLHVMLSTLIYVPLLILVGLLVLYTLYKRKYVSNEAHR